MGSSVSGQDDLNRALWLATRAGKMKPSCTLRTTRFIPQAKFPLKPYNKSFIDQVCSVKMTGYWPRSFFASLWTSTLSRSINTQKKNLANIQPSWPDTWSITHTYCQLAIFRFDSSLCKQVLNNASEEGMIIMFQVGIILPEAFTFKLYVQINPKF